MLSRSSAGASTPEPAGVFYFRKMALRDQPYFPLYVQDYLTDEKLNLCSPAAQGVYVKIMCIFHKMDPYGGILFKQNDKQKGSMRLNFAYKLANLLPFSEEVILSALDELLEEKVLQIEDNFLFQKRMVADNEVSMKRSMAGRKGGGNPFLFKQNDKQKDKQNTEYENENNKEKGVQGEKQKISESFCFDPDETLEIFLSEKSWKEKICIRFGIEIIETDRYIKEFIDDQKIKKAGLRSLNSSREHFVNWLNVQVRNQKQNRTVVRSAVTPQNIEDKIKEFKNGKKIE